MKKVSNRSRVESRRGRVASSWESKYSGWFFSPFFEWRAQYQFAHNLRYITFVAGCIGIREISSGL
jgi:hypothetical protein